jgi:hypothetical protein
MNVAAEAAALVQPIGALSIVPALAAVNNTVAVGSTVSAALSYVTASLSEAERTALSWSLEDLLDWCTYEEKPCDIEYSAERVKCSIRALSGVVTRHKRDSALRPRASAQRAFFIGCLLRTLRICPPS